MWRNTSNRYGCLSIGLHWVIALLVIGLLTLGLYMTSQKMSPDIMRLYGLHKSFGITVLALVALRLSWRVYNHAPDLPVTMNRLERVLAKSTHWLFYVLLLGMPLSGWAMSSAGSHPVSFFGWFTLPGLLAPNKPLGHQFGEAHEIIGWTLIVLISLHVLAALYHHFIKKDDILRRMLPSCTACGKE